MERFIFDNRSSFNDQPMFLKRTIKASSTSFQKPVTQSNWNKKRKSDFDYSYYSQLHAYASAPNTKRMSSLSPLLDR